MPLVLLGITVAVFFTFTDPVYKGVQALRAEADSYNEALTNSKALETERGKLLNKYNLIGSENLGRLSKLLPENVDNIRLILEIESLASPFGMVLKNVKYSAVEESQAEIDPNVVQATGIMGPQDYGIWDLEFTTSGSYDNFQNFLRELERNLRIVDVSSIEFSSSSANEKTPDIYEYNFQIKTYWLRN